MPPIRRDRFPIRLLIGANSVLPCLMMAAGGCTLLLIENTREGVEWEEEYDVISAKISDSYSHQEIWQHCRILSRMYSEFRLRFELLPGLEFNSTYRSNF